MRLTACAAATAPGKTISKAESNYHIIQSDEAIYPRWPSAPPAGSTTRTWPRAARAWPTVSPVAVAFGEVEDAELAGALLAAEEATE